MPTLSEILAKKNSRKGGSATAADVTGASAVGTGTVIRQEDEKAKLAASIKFTLDASSPKLPKAHPPATADTRRELGAMEPGERLPMDHPTSEAPDAAWEWFDSLHSFETDLGIVVDPNGDHAWLAVNSRQFQPPLLLLKLPLINRKEYGNPF